jgi:hypothetical protein
MTDTPKMTRSWGYKVGDAQIFVLPEGADLPEGWVSSPAMLPEPEIVDEPETAYDGSDWEQLYVAADTRAKMLEIENASLKEEVSALLEQMSAAPMDDPELVIPHPGAAPEEKHWSELHHSTRIRMAKEVAPDIAELITNAKEADEILAKHEADLNG